MRLSKSSRPESRHWVDLLFRLTVQFQGDMEDLDVDNTGLAIKAKPTLLVHHETTVAKIKKSCLHYSSSRTFG